VLTLAMFMGSFAWAFVYVPLPFYIEQVSTAGVAGTLAWTGWIIGVTSLVAVVSGPVGAHFAARGDIKRACVLVQLGQGIGFVVIGLADSVLELFLARLALGVVGSASTFAFLLASRARPFPGEADPVRRRLASIQAALMIAQVIGPLVGTVVAVRLGFRLTYLVGGLILVAGAAVVEWGEPAPPAASAAAVAHRRYPVRAIVLAAAVVLAASCQETFLAAVLPQVLPGLGVGPERALEAGGLLLFSSGTAAALGGLAAPRLAQLWHERRLVPALIALSSASLAALALAGSLWVYVTLRVLQSLLIAPVFPLVVARIARFAGGEAIGIVNAARVGSGFVGPVAATTVLAWGSPAWVYLVLAAGGVAAALALRR
jgi:DHA1 family multidrug resistance protein-like MFS transporter